MIEILSFGQVVEAADNLSEEEQETLIDLLSRRLIERRREKLAKEIKDAQQEFKAGLCKPATSDEIMKEILS